VRPRAGVQIRWGLAAALLALGFVVVLATAPDPFFRQTVYATTFDNVDAVVPGAPVYFRGAALGSVRSVDLMPDTRTFAVRLGVRRDWRASACTHAEIVESNPLTPPQIELTALEITSASCAAARAADGCAVLKPPVEGARGIAGCRRGPDLFETAAVAIAQAAEVAKAANTMAVQVQAMLPKGGGGGPGGMPVDVNRLGRDVTTMLATLNEITARLNATLDPARGDVALALANVRRASGSAAELSGKAATVDVARLNETLVEVQDLVRQNQGNVNTLLAESANLSVESRALLENASAQIGAATVNLQSTTESLSALTERLEDDPTYVIRGQRFSNPPPVSPQ